MCWLYLLLSSILEILWAVTLKFSNSFTKVVPSIATLVIMIISIYFLSLAACFLPIRVCYAVSSGICTIGITIIGATTFTENINLSQVLCIVLIVIGSIGLKLSI
ncbi:QacE family quaternary ammonium compound efflux SMR transporter [Wolbachia endosymbiont of Carposina sasakii]|uniref:DMT family transporter n=1 Tax=Wolbachia TaxID=953 RepID=UPI0000DAED59|nr:MULTISPECIES: SMR family transporter [Wolbachia]MDE5062773.1 SMR family transporter [Wolbachia endosymbiont of Drosophila chauvacae]MDX5496270.1 SMR family transporter [Wolbachia endosymbiont of Nomada fabriciana]MDX5507520.1 SMR family transporter [Wolbachia endosymbiont of Hylaeus sinuatus]MDX5518432.1 SMR family transporter [Wolbachia endosymbiont of Andrena agilissima]MDX5527421.1 SMR family transporter [Wolbachia endosymbiont of Andrena minutula]CDR78527.1 multidrug resistance protein